MRAARFPPHFRFGVATAATQIEGATREDGRGPSIWDTFAATPGTIRNGDTPSIACDSYHRWRDDIDLMSGLGVDGYRMSLSWSRIFPEGTGRINQAGVDHYSRVIDGLLDRGIAPNITLYHWDLPQALEDRGGWVNRDVASWFGDYASTVFDAYGDRVPLWATLNEPISIWVGYGLGWFAPGRADEQDGRQATHNALLAHGRAVEAFRSGERAGDIGIVVDIWKRTPASDSLADAALAARGDDDGFRCFLDPVFTGGYSDRFLSRLEAEGTMPDIRDGDFESIAQPIDYYGLNVYGRVVVDAEKTDPRAWAQSNPQPGGNFLDSGQEYYPRAVFEALELLRDDYGWTGPVYVTENGVPDGPSLVDPFDDHERIAYVDGFLEWIASAIDAGHDVRGYYLWSLLDNFEWSAGYEMRYGLASVDAETLERVPKRSARWYADLIAAHRSARPSDEPVD